MRAAAARAKKNKGAGGVAGRGGGGFRYGKRGGSPYGRGGGYGGGYGGGFGGGYGGGFGGGFGGGAMAFNNQAAFKPPGAQYFPNPQTARGGGGGGRGQPRACYRCGNLGHLQDACPTAPPRI